CRGYPTGDRAGGGGRPDPGRAPGSEPAAGRGWPRRARARDGRRRRGDGRHRRRSMTGPEAAISAASLFVVSGGARGITPHCWIALARRSGCRFLLLGRSDAAGEEPAWAEGCTDRAELQRRIVADLTARGERPAPPAIRAELNRILARREIAATLRAVEEAGGS